MGGWYLHPGPGKSVHLRRVKEDREKLALMFATVQRLEEENQALKAVQKGAANRKVAELAQEFRDNHSWYQGPASDDLDSRNLTAIDNALAAEGWDMSTKEYWQELERRLTAEGLPRNQFELSAERKNAMKEAGLWRDINIRNLMILAYKQVDANQKRRGL